MAGMELVAVLGRVRARLAQQLRENENGYGQNGEGLEKLSPTGDDLTTLAQTMGLSVFERELLWLCAAAALDKNTAELLVKAHGKPYPTLALAAGLLDGGHGDALSPARPLRYWQLIDIVQPPEIPLPQAALRIDERILHYIQGHNHLDGRLQPYLSPVETSQAIKPLPPSQQKLVDYMVMMVRETPQPPILQLVGIDAESKQVMVQQGAVQLGVKLYRLPTGLIPPGSSELDLFARLWAREGALWPIALYLDAQELDAESEPDKIGLVLRFLQRSGGLFFLSTHDAWNKIDGQTLTIDVNKPTPEEQAALWREHLPTLAAEMPEQLAGCFNLSMPAVEQVSQMAQETASELTPKQVWDACLIQTRPRLDMLAQRIVPKATWEDIVLPDPQMALLRRITTQVAQRGQVHNKWGWQRKMNRGLGMTVLFSGESGTGKTMSAEVIANHLQLNLYRIDLSQVVSKYIGETEKNLRKLFDAAEDGGVLLFFDEADALFGKRSQVKDSHDRYANIETNYLLQRLEAYQGLAILATNALSSLDDAFMRRLRFIVKFPVPEDVHRKLIWQKVFPLETPLAELDYTYLARFKLAGGSIYNIALNASFHAAEQGTDVSMKHILEATQVEFDKDSRLTDPRDFVWPRPG